MVSRLLDFSDFVSIWKKLLAESSVAHSNHLLLGWSYGVPSYRLVPETGSLTEVQ